MLRPWQFQIIFNPEEQKAVYLQIADSIIQAIKQGILRSGEALPGSRKLAEQIKANRNTVVKAIDVLLAEGWLVAVERKGVFVAEIHDQPNLSAQVKRSALNPSENQQKIKPKVVFDDGFPDSRLAPIKELARAHRQIFNRKAKWQMMGYGDAQGDVTFREAIVQMLNHRRGMQLETGNVCITRGSQMAIYLVAQCLLEKGDLVAVENPGYRPAWQAFQRAGAQLVPISMEADGLNIDHLRLALYQGKKIRALYTTPHHQFPTTVSLSLQKRMELIKLSNEYGFTIIEDDYDHEFHFSSRPLTPIGSLSTIENYIYIGTISKIVSPALRIGYVASQASLIADMVDLRKIIDVQGDNIMEQALLELINDGSIRKHLNKATKRYQEKRDLFDQIVLKYLHDKVIYEKPEGGLAFWLVPKSHKNMFELAERLKSKGVQLLTPDKFSLEDPIMGMRLGYASLSEEQIESGIFEIARSL